MQVTKEKLMHLGNGKFGNHLLKDKHRPGWLRADS
jgi:hypothetical protein